MSRLLSVTAVWCSEHVVEVEDDETLGELLERMRDLSEGVRLVAISAQTVEGAIDVTIDELLSEDAPNAPKSEESDD